MRSITEITPATGTRPYVRALATSQGHHWSGIRAADDGADFLAMQEAHDQISDAYFKRADDEVEIALELRDWSLIHNHLRVSLQLRAEGYRYEALEDERRDQARAALSEVHEANLSGSFVCEQVLITKRLERESEAPDAA